WGDRLPVWVPFPLWTRLLSDTQQHATSLGDLLRHHLHSNQQAHLWPLVASALDDDRLLLLVDGLDEYESVPAGNLALQRLGVLLEQGRARAVLVSRPAGYSRLQVSSNWRSCTLAPLSTAQQRELASRWLTHLWSGQGVAEEALEAKVRRFSGALVGEIGEVGQLREMAGVPLLFSLILWVRLTHGTVPTSRFKVYAQFITHLIQKHPNLRRAAAEANPQPPPFDLEQLTAAFEALAYEMQAAGGSGLIERTEARGRLVRLMTDPDGLFGLTTPEAIRKSSELLEVGEASLGLLANRSQTELGFLHRAFQEYLCAAFVSRLPFDEQLGMVRARCGDPQWREVLLSLLHRSERADEPTRLVTALREEGRKDHQRIAVQTILAEAAFGDFRLPAATAKQLAAEALEAVEADLPRAHREHLLRIVLGGRQSSRVGGLVRQRLAGWFPQRWGDDFYLFNAMGNWPPEPETVEALMRGLCAEEFEAQLGAATSLARLMPGDPQTQRRLVRLAQTAPRPEVRAAALEALMQGWPSCAELSDLALRFIASPSQVMQLYGIKHRVRTGTHDQSLLNLLLRLASRHRGLGYGHRTAMTALLVEGWPGHPGLKEAALRGCGPYTHQDSNPDFPVMEEEVAYGVLIAGFKGDPDAAAALVLELQSDHPFSGTERWNLWEDLQKHWRGSPALAAALEQLLRASGDQKELRDLERALAARFVGTDAAKRLLLSDLEAADGFDNPTLRALQEGWGITDPEVKKTLGSLVEQGKDEGIAHLLPDIMDDPIKVRARLLELLAGDERAFYRAMIGLEKLGAIADDAEAYALIKARILSKKDSWDDRYFHFAGWFAANDEVYPICLDLLESGLLYPGSFARAFGHKPEARELVRRHA
ncbi:HEAT repeat domain-containing protein, partial [uncultured Meiothermus sp.]|uniref:NACHT domain-containing protein n=1 Tax=uncultured Meiothermus sp. TaxID=157471 RepID=UPI002601E415